MIPIQCHLNNISIEVTSTIKEHCVRNSLKDFSAPGKDILFNCMLKHSSDDSLLVFLQILGSLCIKNINQNSWKEYIIVIIGKVNKDLHVAEGCRPIYPSSVLGKSIEKSLKCRLDWQSNNHLSSTQFDFRKGKF